MFPESIYNKLRHSSDVKEMHDNFMMCKTEMCFSRRYVNKDMLVQKLYDADEDKNQLMTYFVPFANQQYKMYTGGSFSVHTENIDMVPLFKRWHMLLDSRCMSLHLNLPEDVDTTQIKLLRSSGKIQDGWLNKTTSLKFINKPTGATPHIHIYFLQSPQDILEAIEGECKEFLQMNLPDETVHESFTLANFTIDEILRMNDSQTQFTDSFLDYFHGVCEPGMDNEKMSQFIKTTEYIMTNKVMYKYVPLAEFSRLNPDFNVKMDVLRLKEDEESTIAVQMMARILNEFLDYQVKEIQKHTSITETEKFFELITVV